MWSSFFVISVVGDLFNLLSDVKFIRYERFVIALEEASRDDLPALKTKALKVVFLTLTHCT